MKTVKDVQKEITELSEEIKDLDKYADKKSIALRKRLRAKLPQLRLYIAYLRTEPTEEFCKKEVKRLSHRIDEILKHYTLPENHERFTKTQLTAMRKSFEKGWDIPKLRKQLMAVSYLLK